MRLLLPLLALAACESPAVPADLAAPPDLAPAQFSTPIVLSDPSAASFVPSVAVRDRVVLVAWHDFPVGGTAKRVRYVVITDGVVGPTRSPMDSAPDLSRPQVVTTQSGFFIFYDANVGKDEVHGVALDAAGEPIAAAERWSEVGK